MPNSAIAFAAERNQPAWGAFRNPFRRGYLRIGRRLTTCFVAIVLSMLLSDLVAFWQFSRIATSGQQLNQADQVSLAVIRIHLNVDTFRDRLAALVNTHDTRQFKSEAAAVRQKFLEDVAHAQQLLETLPGIGENARILSAVRTLRITLPSQLNTVVELADSGDWEAVRLRLADQMSALIHLSSSLVTSVDQELSYRRAQAMENSRRAQAHLFLILPTTGVVTLLMAIALGWYATRSITFPLFALEAGAQALARGEFEYEVEVYGRDELATVGTAFNSAARRLRELYDGLRDSEEQWRAAFESNPTMYFMVGKTGTILSVNAFGAEQLGYSASELVGQPVLDVFYEPDREAIRERTETCFEQLGRTMRWEARTIRKDGTMLWVRETANAVVLKKRPVLLVVCEDITERKRAEETVRRSEKELRDVIETIPAMAFTALPNGSVASMNRRWSEYTDLSEEKSSGSGWQRAVHPEDIERYIGKWHASLTVGRPFEHETRFRRAADGEYRWFLVRAVPVLDEQGNVLKWYGVLIDIEDRKRAEEALRESETRFRTFVDHATDALIVFDEQRKIVDVNRQASETLGYSREELIGTTPLDFDVAKDQEFARRLSDRFETGEIVSFETYLRRKDGTVFPVEVRVRPFWHGGHRFALALARDITDRKRAEQERERLRQLQADLAHINRVTTMGELTVSLAHELNQPIAAAITNANTCVRWLIRDQPDLEEAREAARRTVKDGTRAAEIIKRIRLLFQKGVPQREAIDVNDVVREMILLLRSQATEHQVAVRTELSAGLPLVMVDRVQLQQVLMNLMINAIEAMKDMDGKRELTLRSQSDGTDQLLISVSDTGVGLPPEANQLFDAFFTTKPEGTGMGLAISRSIVEAQGGRLWASSNSSSGATFCFTLRTSTEAHS
jgi:PAS domain S-box-containing protein